MSETAELFTWKCLTTEHCKGCIVAAYVDRYALSDEQKLELQEVSTSAGSYYRQSGNRDEVVDRLSGCPVISLEEARIAMDGYLQSRECTTD